MPARPPEGPRARARLFVALALAPEARTPLARWSRETLADDESLRLVPEDSLHVTLVFLGWREERDVAAVATAVDAAARGRPAPLMRARELVPLPRHAARVLALDLVDEGDRASAVQAAVESGLAEAGLHVPERRRFRAHVTVARVRRGRRPPTGRFPDPPPEPLHASEVVVCRSELSPRGARYTALARTPLS